MSENIWTSLDRILHMSASGASATAHEAATRGRRLEAQLAALESERDLMREALEKISDIGPYGGHDAMKIARAALTCAGKQEGDK